jgi:HEPN domain-containing protein
MNLLIGMIDEQLAAATAAKNAGRHEDARFHQQEALTKAVVGVMRELSGLRADLEERA